MSEESEKYEIIMLTQDGCGHCANAKNILKEKIDSGKIIVMDVIKDNQALDLANKYNVRGVPAIILKDKVTQLTESCELSLDGSKIVCKDKEVKL
ncbi:MAG TPA: hypothetical protein ENI29_05460 [bacterium]|nr:hypothetical protein [bacterium]